MSPSLQATMCDDDDGSFSVVSTAPDIATVYTPSQTGNDSDEFDLLESDDYAEDQGRWEVGSGCSTSVSPIVYDHEMVFGRRYHGYKRGLYPLPNDDLERQREETKHAMMLQLTDGHLFYADIGDHPQKIIDIGTGIGSWPIDVADLYPSASVIGTDLSPIQPTWLPVNARMFVEDCEDTEWLHGSGFDLVHYRGMASMVKDLDGLLAKSYPHIKNGGWVEFHEFIPQILCDDGTMQENDPLRLFLDISNQGLRKFGYTAIKPGDLENALERAGFTNIQCITKKVPIAPWTQDKKLQTIGMFMKATILDVLSALATKPLATLDITKETRRAAVDLARKSLSDRKPHRYVNCCFCYGQKKEQVISRASSFM